MSHVTDTERQENAGIRKGTTKSAYTQEKQVVAYKKGEQ